MVGLATLLLREITTLVEAVHEALQSEATVWTTKDRVLPPLLMVLVLAVITLFDSLYFFSSEPWAHVMPPSGGLVLSSRPVHTLRYAEWVITVPILLLLTGYCALLRPLKEVLVPIIVTNVYVTLAWVAMVVGTPWLRWSVVLFCFIGYFFASWWMWRWAATFLSLVPEETPSRHLRASLVVLLVSLFGLYAVVYLGAMTDLWDAHFEKAAYTFLGFLAKVAMSCIFTSIRASEHRQTMDSLLCRVGSLNTTITSLLRGSFDVVLPCTATESGCCKLSEQDTGEMRELSIFLGRSMMGVKINSILVGAEEQERFAVYVRNSLRQSEGQLPFGQSRWSVSGNWVDSACGQKPPLAQLLNVKMARCSVSGQSLVNVVIYLASVPRSGGLVQGSAAQMLAAFRFEDCVPMPVLMAEGSAAAALAERQQTAVAEKQPARSKKLAAGAEGGEQVRMSHIMKVMARKKIQKMAKQLGGVETRTSTRKGSNKASSRSGSKDAPAMPQKSREEDSKKSAGAKRAAVAPPAADKLGAPPRSMTQVTYPGACNPTVGHDVMSQSSKISGAGSVTAACRQLLGPLADHLPPPHLVSRRMEDHVQCAAEMVKIRAPAEIARLHHQQELAEWKERCRARVISEMLHNSSAPDTGVDESVWRKEILPKLEAPHPGKMPDQPDLPDNEELWQRAWKATYEEEPISEGDTADSQH